MSKFIKEPFPLLKPLLFLCLLVWCYPMFGGNEDNMRQLLKEGESLYNSADYRGAIRSFSELFTLAEKVNDISMMCHAQYNLGVAYMGICDTGSAMSHFKEAYELLSQGAENPKREVEILSGIGGVYFMEGDYAEAYKNLEIASKIAKENNDSVMQLNNILNMALISNKRRDFKTSERLIADARRSKSLSSQYKVRLKEVEAESYILRDMWQQADSVALTVLNSADSVYGNKGLMYVYLMKSANHRLAPNEALRISGKAHKVIDLANKPYYFYQLSEAYKIAGDYSKALAAKDSMTFYKDSLDNLNNRKIIEDSRIALEIKTQQLEIDKKLAKTKSQTMIAISLSCIFLLLLVIAGLVIYYQRQKNRERQETLRLRIAKEQKERELAEERMKETELLSDLQEEMYRKELEHKNMEIKANAMFISSRKSLLEEIISYLDKFEDRGALPEIKRLRQHLSRMLHNEGMDRKEFMNNFDAIDPEFSRTLLEIHPNLLQSDLKFLSLIKMNMSMKEIGAVLNINPDSSKRRKIRLSKKLGLKSSAELYPYLLSI